MRFSIQLAGFLTYKARVDGATIVIRKRLWPLGLSSGEWRWIWRDGTQMRLTYKRQDNHYVRHELLAGGEAVCHAMVRVPLLFNWRWEETTWTCDERQLTNRRVPRRVTSRRGMFACTRNVLNLTGGRTAVSWSDDCCSHSWQGVIRSSLDDKLVRAAFGIVVALCLLEQSGDST